jgi:HEPN domain-containing protein
MDRNEKIRYWIDSSDSDARAMRHLFSNSDYTWALFLGHIVVEKLLKALFVVNNDESPPLTHDLTRLAEKAELGLDTQQMDFLDTVTTFNIRARYDDFKNEFSARCTKEYAEAMIDKIEELRSWIKNKL